MVPPIPKMAISTPHQRSQQAPFTPLTHNPLHL